MNGTLLASDILIELPGRNEPVSKHFEQLLRGSAEACCSAVSVTEISQGARDTEGDSIASLLALITCVPVTCAVAATAGEILKLTLRTRNRKYFPDPALRFYN